MRSMTLVLASTLVTLTCFTDFSAAPRDVSLADRIEAQRRIERIRHAHQIGERRPFEAVFPRPLLERKVETYLRQSLALERIWKTPVTAAMLSAEAERMQRGTRMPERLAEFQRALDDDPVLILECLVRPVLVERLARERFASDPEIHADASRAAELLRAELSGGILNPRENHPARRLIEVVLADRPMNATHDRLELPRDQYESMRGRAPAGMGVIGPVQDEGDRFVTRVVLEERPGRFLLATFSVEKRTWDDWWLTVEQGLDPLEAETVASSHDHLPAGAGALGLSCSPEAWDNGALDDLSDAPPGGSHTAVWTGSVAIVWGSDVEWSMVPAGGGRYDPATDTWSPISQVNAPAARIGHTAVWTDAEMLVWGGSVFNGTSYSSVVNGGRYDPLSDTWSTMAVAGAPGPQCDTTAVWTGTQMLVWGVLGCGGRYDPSTDTWSPISTAGAPTPRSGYTAVWTGSRMIVWGGWRDPDWLNDGGQYNPNTDTWTSLSTAGAPSPRTGHTAVWTGKFMVVAGGYGGGVPLPYGGRYDPSRDRWQSTVSLGERRDHTAVWTGSRMLVWGGSPSAAGYAYDPERDEVSAISSAGQPSGGGWGHVAVWAGDIMLVHGGQYRSGHGYGRYHAASDTWLPTASSMEPRGRMGHSAVWSGNLMLIWGGIEDTLDASTVLDTGFAYEPATDSFSPLATLNAPAARWRHTAVWSGSLMLVWGGGVTTGGRYDPLAGVWTPMTTSGQPSARLGNSAVWTGSEMVVWGGYTSFVCGPGVCESMYGDGGRYDPASETWTYIPSTGAPQARAFHTAVSSGSRMVIWGGEYCPFFCPGPENRTVLSTGGVLDLTTGGWSSTSAAPLAPRSGHSAVWAGDQVIIWGGGMFTWVGGLTSVFYQDGARYDPSTNLWSSLGSISAPSARRDHSTVWTGTEMVVWGGIGASGYLGDGARYRPLSDTWAALPLTGAPAARAGAPAVWTGEAMMFWGGEAPGGRLRSGGRYVPMSDLDADGFSTCDDCDDASAAVYPGASQACDGINNDCTDPAWPAVPASEQDADGDGFRGCAGAQPADCDDAAPGSWSPPGEARDLDLVAAAGDMLVWEAPLDGGAASVSYDVLRAADSVDFGPSATCVESDESADRIAVDTTTPLPGGIYFYLVRVENGCPAGQNQNMGADSGGTPRSGRACP